MNCAHFAAGRCRSCTELRQPYAVQLAAKEAHCRALLAGVSPAPQWLPAVASRDSGFRNKAKMVVSGSVSHPVLGILDANGQGVDLTDCGLYPASLQACFAPLAAFIPQAAIAPYDLARRRGELKYLLVTEADDGGLMLRFVLRSEESLGRIRKHLPALLERLPALRVVSANLQPEHKAILEGEREILLSPQDRLRIRVNALALHLRPRSFFQTHTAVAAALYAQARDWVAEINPATVWDLYCGVGGFALHCAAGNRDVTGIELSAEAIASAMQSAVESAPGHAGFDRLRFECADATAWALAQQHSAELVIVNPPRRGIGETLARHLESSERLRWLIYSSCNAESLARDLAWMPSLQLRQARVLDMFPQTRHYEVIVLLERVLPSPA